MKKKYALVAAVGAVLALAAVSSPAIGASSVAVKTKPASFTPWLPSSAPGQYVQQLAQCGGTMYAVGKINTVEQGTTTYSRGNAFSFSATDGTMTSWDPQVNGAINSIALSPDCSVAYLGGVFTSAGGGTVKNIAAVSTTTGALVSGFEDTANAGIETLVYTPGELLVGGFFTKISGKSRTMFASLNPSTGVATDYANLPISGGYPQSPKSKIYNSELSHDGTKLLVEGVFTSIGGQPRQQVAMIDLGGSSATVDAWYPTEFNQTCIANKNFYAKGAAWSPDDSTVYVANTGYLPASGLGSRTSDPRSQLCDSAAAFPATSGPVVHTWINYTGCDSLFAVAADTNDVYVGGHERFIDNSNGCDRLGPGGQGRQGVGDVNATSGMANAWNPTRSRGHGVNDLLLTGAGLWIASDNGSKAGASQTCGHYTNHGSICFLPY